ncbi:MAG: RdgB/HAM1 family non-canonical purine NTP pyrophosphatase [candidate division Zixibacteria bacterium]
MEKLILATNNRHKVSEIEDILKGINVEILSAADFVDFPDVEETGKTLEENAVIKALAIREKYGLPCLADDTGLEVDYLNGAPGVYSARFAGDGCSFDDNNKKLLRLLDGVPLEKRVAVFKTVIALVDKKGEVETVEGTLTGYIGFETTGNYGFGYDPVFVVNERTLAEITPQEKNRISHRSAALRRIKPIIEEAFSA